MFYNIYIEIYTIPRPPVVPNRFGLVGLGWVPGGSKDLKRYDWRCREYIYIYSPIGSQTHPQEVLSLGFLQYSNIYVLKLLQFFHGILLHHDCLFFPRPGLGSLLFKASLVRSISMRDEKQCTLTTYAGPKGFVCGR